MSEKQLSILIKLRDEASQQFKTFSAQVERSLIKVTKSIDAAGDSLVSMGRQVSQAGKNMVFLGAILTGPLILAFKTASNYSVEMHESLKRLGDSFNNLQITIGEAILPIVEKITGLIVNLTNWFNNLDPKIRDTSLQIMLMTGIFLGLGGAMSNISGKILILVGSMLKFAAVHPIMFTIIGALALMIVYWDKISFIAIPTLNALEIGLAGVGIGFWRVIQAVAKVSEWAADILIKLANFIAFFERLPGMPQYFTNISKELQAFNVEMKTTGPAAQIMIDNLTAHMATSMETGKGTITEGIDIIKQLWDFLSNPPLAQIGTAFEDFKLNFQQTFLQAYQNAINIGKQSADILVNQVTTFSTKFGQAFAAMVMHGKNFGESMKQVFIEMAEAFIAEVARMIAQWVAFMAIRAVVKIATAGFFHEGGTVGEEMHRGGPIRAHSGLAIDEVPIIAQTGEGILSRRGMAAMGISNLNALNSGRAVGASGRGGNVTTINMSINLAGAYIGAEEIADQILPAIKSKLDRLDFNERRRF